MDLLSCDALTLGAMIRRGEVRAADAAAAAIRAAKEDPYNAYITIDEAGAMEQAHLVDERLKKGEGLSPLAGVPIAVKDNILIKGLKNTCASRMMKDYVAPYDAAVVEHLRSAGMVIIGKSNLDEFAMGSTNTTSCFGKVLNPFDVQRVPGGSSGGSAAAVAGRLVPLSLGTDTGGSVRQPSAMCGIVGLKPTYGSISRYGVVAHASSLDQVGLMARTAADVKALLHLVCTKDDRDSTSVGLQDHGHRSVKGLTIGIPKAYFEDGVDEDVRTGALKGAEQMERLGAKLVEIHMATLKYAMPTYYAISASEASSNMARFDGVRYGSRAENYENLNELYAASRGEGFGRVVRQRLLLGSYALKGENYEEIFLRAAKVRTVIKREFDEVLSKCDIVLTPTSPITALKFGEDREGPLDIFTASVSLCGLPGLSIPCGFDRNGLPIGMQFIGRAFEDDLLLDAAMEYQSVTEHHKAAPMGRCSHEV